MENSCDQFMFSALCGFAERIAIVLEFSDSFSSTIRRISMRTRVPVIGLAVTVKYR